MTMTPAKLRKACDKVGGVYAMARLLGKGHPPQYLYRRINRKVGLDPAGDSLRLRPPTHPLVLPVVPGHPEVGAGRELVGVPPGISLVQRKLAGDFDCLG